MIEHNFRNIFLAPKYHSNLRARKIKNEVGKHIAMYLVKMKKFSSSILLSGCILLSPALVWGAKKPSDRSPSQRGDTYILNSVWDSIAFWKKDEPSFRLQYLTDTPPPSVEFRPFQHNMDESAYFAYPPQQNLPESGKIKNTEIPSFSGFLANMKAIDELADSETETDTTDADLEADEAAEAIPEVTLTVENEPEIQRPDNSTDFGDEYSSNLEAIFPRPYEKFVSGERLLMFFPVDHSNLENSRAPSLMVPIDSNLSFHPPSTNIPRSSATIRREN